MIPIDNEKEIMKCMEQELNLFVKLDHLSVKLKDAVSDTEKYMMIESIVDDKTCITGEIERISAMRRCMTEFSGVTNENIKRLSNKIKEILTKIIEYDRICEEELIKTQIGISERLSKINNSLQSAKTFPRGVKPPSYLSIKL